MQPKTKIGPARPENGVRGAAAVLQKPRLFSMFRLLYAQHRLSSSHLAVYTCSLSPQAASSLVAASICPFKPFISDPTCSEELLPSKYSDTCTLRFTVENRPSFFLFFFLPLSSFFLFSFLFFSALRLCVEPRLRGRMVNSVKNLRVSG